MTLAIFDLDNTLIDRSASFRRWAERFAAARSLGPEDVSWLVGADQDGFAERNAFMTAVKERCRLPDAVGDLLAGYRAEIVAAVELDPGIPPALDALRSAGWRIAIATNGGAAQQAAKIRQAGLTAYVDAVAISEEVGAKKPDRRMFEAAAERCGAALGGGVWMVGDCPDRDVAGAQQAGLRTIWMRRGREWSPLAPAPTAIADNIPAAVSVIVQAY
jgi:HAD superfamily hydrolase (TIGR01509 family)